MLFNSFSYIIFLLLVTISFFLIQHKYRWILLLIFSYYFYMSWNTELVTLILFTTVTSYFSAIAIEKSQNKRTKKICLLLGVTVSFIFLFFFKYFNFVSASITSFFNIFGFGVNPVTLKLILPVGISFYTFQTVSYIIDVYKGDLKAEHHLGIYMLYVSFFPQLVAGPIERAVNLLPQLYTEKKFDTARCSDGIRKIIWGMFKKVVIADTVAVYVNALYNNIGGSTGLTLISATLLFALQIYCDFSGYSDIAIGSAQILGFDLMTNFKSPYFSKSIKEFWRRWHISLSTWFTDYVYIPLGGNRVSKSRHCINLLITFLLSGLWHGANYTFIIWGFYNGLLLVIETFSLPFLDKFENNLGKAASFIFSNIRRLITFALINIGWVFFRANNLHDVAYVFKNFYKGLNPLRITEYVAVMGITPQILLGILAITLILAVYDGYSYFKGDPLEDIKKCPVAVRYILYYSFITIIFIVLYMRPSDAPADFIYFQF